MKVIILVIILFFILFSSAFTQYKVDWTLQHNNGTGGTNSIQNIEVDHEGNIFMWGAVKDNGYTGALDILVCAYDIEGNLLFNYVIDGPDNNHPDSMNGDYYYNATIDSLGNFYILCHINFLDADYQLMRRPTLIQYNKFGEVGRIRVSKNLDNWVKIKSDKLGNVIIASEKATALIRSGPIQVWHEDYSGPSGKYTNMSPQIAFDNKGTAYVAREWGEVEVPCNPPNLPSVLEKSTYINKYSSIGREKEWVVNKLPCVDCESYSPGCHEYPWWLGADTLGYVYLIHNSQTIYGVALSKFDSTGSLQWEVPIHEANGYEHSTINDDDGNVYMWVQKAPPYYLVKHSADNGQVLWERWTGNQNRIHFFIGPDGSIYNIARYHTFRWTPDDKRVFWGENPATTGDIGSRGKRIGPDGSMYSAFNNGKLYHFNPQKFFMVADYLEDPLDSIEFDLIRLDDDLPYYTEDTLGTFIPDSLGLFEFEFIYGDTFLFRTDQYDPEPDTVVVGEFMKVSKHLHSEPAIKHNALLGTMYSMHIDNLHFDSLGKAAFDTICHATQWIMMDHVEYRYNLLASLEWDAKPDYIAGLMDEFMAMSNYIYDVTDGQMRLDTIMIYDDRNNWLLADIQIYAENNLIANAFAKGITDPGSNINMKMPRKDYCCNEDDMRNRSYNDYSIMNYVSTEHHRILGHEWGHYAMNFRDEYEYMDDAGNYLSNADRCNDLDYPETYGMMDAPYEHNGEWGTEMSSKSRYSNPNCQNTEHYMSRDSSCWDYWNMITVDSVIIDVDTIKTPTIRPEQRQLADGYNYLQGPNNDINNLDYDVGDKIHFKEFPTSSAARTLQVIVEDISNNPWPKAKVELLENLGLGLGWHTIIQGETSDSGGIYILGAETGDQISTVGSHTIIGTNKSVDTSIIKEWYFGEATVGGSGESRFGNSYSSQITEEIMNLEMLKVEGYFPLINRIDLNYENINYNIDYKTGFSEIPGLSLFTFQDDNYDYTLTDETGYYTVTSSENLSESGRFKVTASDNSPKSFFYPADYIFAEFNTGSFVRTIIGTSGKSELQLDASNTEITKGIILSTSYPVIRNGLANSAIQAGDAHSVAVYPEMNEGVNKFTTVYSDEDLNINDIIFGDESTLKIYYWDDVSRIWQLIGGTVDTSRNEVTGTIKKSGVYAAFTYDVITDVDDNDYGELLPYHFELSQNYPNPFNPVTTIEYSLPQRSHVNIDVYNILGQKVVSLVDTDKPAGSHSTSWDGKTNSGQQVSSGIYLYRFQAGDHVETKKMLLLK